jgi:DNA-binding NtrC family response regulator
MSATDAVHKILVLASDPVLAALIGNLVETARLRAEFPRADERPEQALARLRPLAAILVDAVTDGAESDLFLARARRSGVEVLMFGSSDSVKRRRDWANRQSVPSFELPAQTDELFATLERLRKPSSERARSESRRSGRVERTPTGGLIFEDSKGTRWSIYDRRIERRRAVVDRRFVSDDGQVRHCNITQKEARALSVTTIAAQFERATAE